MQPLRPPHIPSSEIMLLKFYHNNNSKILLGIRNEAILIQPCGRLISSLLWNNDIVFTHFSPSLPHFGVCFLHFFVGSFTDQRRPMHFKRVTDRRQEMVSNLQWIRGAG